MEGSGFRRRGRSRGRAIEHQPSLLRARRGPHDGTSIFHGPGLPYIHACTTRVPNEIIIKVDSKLRLP